MTKWHTPARAALLAGVLFLAAQALAPATVRALCASPLAAGSLLDVLLGHKPSGLNSFPEPPPALLVPKSE